jgi:hypothetical protein
VRLGLAMIDIEGKLCAEDDFDEDFDEYEAANIQSSQVRRADYSEIIKWEQEAKQKQELENHLYVEMSTQDECDYSFP